MAKYLKLSIKGAAIAGAIFWGVYLFVAALFAMKAIDTVWFSNTSFQMIMSIYPGVTATISGAILGLVYGLACGAICGGILSWLYNKFI